MKNFSCELIIHLGISSQGGEQEIVSETQVKEWSWPEGSVLPQSIMQ